jgi:hypothetical protein
VFFFLLLLCRVVVGLEVAKVLNSLLYSVGAVYLSIIREVAEYAVENNVTSTTQLQGLFYSKYRGEYLESHEPSQRSQ